MKKTTVIILMAFAYFLPSWAQEHEPLTLEDCYLLASKNYPLVKHRALVEKASEYSIENIHRGYLPQVNVIGQATYQSQVTEVPLKLPGLPSISKDQYRLYAEGTQLLYDGGYIRQQKELQKANELVEHRRLETDMYQLRERINQLFFGVLIMDEQLRQTGLQSDDIQLGLNKVEAAVQFGTALKSNADVLRAGLLKTGQRKIEILASRGALVRMLSLFIGRDLGGQTRFVRPVPITAPVEIRRPELLLFEAQSGIFDAQDKLLKVKALPKFNLFLQGGVGRPALNMLSNQFEPYYIGGLRFQWTPSVLYTAKRERAINEISRTKLEVQKETFLFNTDLLVKQQSSDIEKYRQLLASDDEIIQLQTRVKHAALAQLENGVINANDYLREVNMEDQARQSRILHETQLLMSQYNLQTTSGSQL